MRRCCAVVVAALMGAGSPAADRPEGRPFATRSVNSIHVFGGFLTLLALYVTPSRPPSKPKAQPS